MKKPIDEKRKDVKSAAAGPEAGQRSGENSGDEKKEAFAGQETNGNSATEAAATEPDATREEQLVDPEKEIARLEDELARTRDAMLRKAAEFENLKRRTKKEKLQLFEEARADALSRFLPIREDLIRSVEASHGKEMEKGIVDGLKLVLSNFERVLQDYGVEPIEETGVPFDVDKHDAMLIQPAPDASTENNTVLQILEPGYRIGDRVIKHAKVIVSQ
jgi:molecular chaperone GrpE